MKAKVSSEDDLDDDGEEIEDDINADLSDEDKLGSTHASPSKREVPATTKSQNPLLPTSKGTDLEEKEQRDQKETEKAEYQRKLLEALKVNEIIHTFLTAMILVTYVIIIYYSNRIPILMMWKQRLQNKNLLFLLPTPFRHSLPTPFRHSLPQRSLRRDQVNFNLIPMFRN